jgi:ankyrin repeat protein
MVQLMSTPVCLLSFCRAAECGRKEIVDILLRVNVRVNETDNKGWAACHAAARGLHDVLSLLLARQPNLAIVDVHGKTAFRIQHCIGLLSR